MHNLKPGGIRHRKDFLGGRPKSDANYDTKKRHQDKNKHHKQDNREIRLFNAICTTCGKPCEVPFRPDGTKPVLCRDCFARKNSAPVNPKQMQREHFANDQHSQRQHETNHIQVLNTENKQNHEKLTQQIFALDNKVNQLLDLIKSLEAKITKEEIVPLAKIKKAAAVKPIKTTKTIKPEVKKEKKSSAKVTTGKKTKEAVKKEPKKIVKKLKVVEKKVKK